MLTAEGCAARRERLRQSLPGPADVLIVAAPASLVHLANYDQSPFTFRSAEAAAVLVIGPDRSVIVGDNIVQPFLEEAHVDDVVAASWYSGTRSAMRRGSLLVEAALDVASEFPGRRVGIELAAVPAGIVEGVRSARLACEVVDLDAAILGNRRRKDPDEVELIRRSIRAIEAGMAAAAGRVEPGMTEFEAYRLIEDAALAEAGERAIVYGDFLAGGRAEGWVGPPTHRKINKGDGFLMDFSVVLNGYRGDLADTIVVGGEPDDEHRRRRDGCLEARAAAEALLKPGTPCREVDAALRRALSRLGLDDYPSHGGHGIGLGHPEPPAIVPESDEVLEAGDVVTLEPGQYGEPFGGMRFERNYLITDDGYEPLSRVRPSQPDS